MILRSSSVMKVPLSFELNGLQTNNEARTRQRECELWLKLTVGKKKKKDWEPSNFLSITAEWLLYYYSYK